MVRMEVIRNEHKILVSNSERKKNHLADLGIDERIILRLQ